MSNAQRDRRTTTRREFKLHDFLAIRDYLLDRRDDLLASGFRIDAKATSEEISMLNMLIAQAANAAADVTNCKL